VMPLAKTQGETLSMELLTAQEASEILKVSDQTVRDMIRSGKLPGFKVGRAWRIRREALEKIIQG